MYSHLTRSTLGCLICLFSLGGNSQSGSIHGSVQLEGIPVEFATVSILDLNAAASTNWKGEFHLHNIAEGEYEVTAHYIGYRDVTETISIKSGQDVNLEFNLVERSLELDEVVVTGTKTFKRQTDSPVIVNVINAETLDGVQACNLSEGLRFQPGLRVETDCQTCNYTQLRMNGLAGGYSQILINGRPIFSPLTGLYGMEQLPVNMIDRIEVVRGGGSSLYGSSAIGGTVNVITKIPRSNSYDVAYTYQNINNQTNDHLATGNVTLVSPNRNSGISLFVNHRERGFYDHNGDNYSEIPLIENTSVGTNFFIIPRDNQKLEVNFSSINEYRFGGEMNLEVPAYLTQQSEERTHNILMGSADYQVNFNEDNTSLITYAAWQNTGRKHYTGIIPDDDDEIQAHIENPPYGTSNVSTYNAGVQLNHRLRNFLNGQNIITLGGEYLYDDVEDEIPSYNYLIDQTTKDIGAFVQSDWQITRSLQLLSGVRMDIHNLVSEPVYSPRVSILYKWRKSTQFRVNYGAGFRAPQAFDTDLHIAFAGGGISRVSLSPGLSPERSQSLSASINYDKANEDFIAGFTLEAFHTRLEDAFYLQPIGEDDFGELFVKENGHGATVQGATMEIRANYNREVQLEGGVTFQTSFFDEPVQYIDNLEGIREFIRTPREYGFATLTITPERDLSATFNYIYTGSMKVPHFAGADNHDLDEIEITNAFHEFSAKISYDLEIKKSGNILELFGGVRNIGNAYQETFDIGKNRDSNYVYGPAQPRTFFVGVKIKG